MYCAKCGQENDDQAQFCQGCGPSLQQASQAPSVPGTSMNKSVLAGIGLIAGIFAIVGIFWPWVMLSGWAGSAHTSAWDSITHIERFGQMLETEGWDILALAGAVLLLVAALSVIAAPKMKVLWGILVTGGLMAIGGAAWALIDIEPRSVTGLSVGYGYGLYLTLGGGILGLSGVLGLKD